MAVSRPKKTRRNCSGSSRRTARSPDMFSKSGFVDLCRADNFGYLGAPGGLTGDRFGAAIDGTRDFDGDGTNDIVIGAQNWSGSG